MFVGGALGFFLDNTIPGGFSGGGEGVWEWGGGVEKEGDIV